MQCVCCICCMLQGFDRHYYLGTERPPPFRLGCRHTCTSSRASLTYIDTRGENQAQDTYLWCYAVPASSVHSSGSSTAAVDIYMQTKWRLPSSDTHLRCLPVTLLMIAAASPKLRSCPTTAAQDQHAFSSLQHFYDCNIVGKKLAQVIVSMVWLNTAVERHLAGFCRCTCRDPRAPLRNTDASYLTCVSTRTYELGIDNLSGSAGTCLKRHDETDKKLKACMLTCCGRADVSGIVSGVPLCSGV